MKILVLSDSHHDNSFINMITRFDFVIHAGDYALKAEEDNRIIYVDGNCDQGNCFEKTFMLEKLKFYLTHGHLYQVKYDLTRLVYKALEQEANVCIFGHTHFQDMFIEKGIIFINPGAYYRGYYAVIEDKSLFFYHRGILVKEYIDLL